MPWREFCVTTSAEGAPRIETVLSDLGALSVTLRDAGDQPLLEPGPGQLPLWDQVYVCALFPGDVPSEAIERRLAQESAIVASRTQYLEDRDWERAWMADFQPMRFGERLWICPSWAEPPEPTAVNLQLDPGLAFGTGGHPTTALCLEWLDANPPQGLEVIDYGCGSGVLAIASLKLGARHCRAVDRDAQALTATRDNAWRNELPEGLITVSAPETMDRSPCDLLVTNILSGPLIELASAIAALVRPGGRLVLSGVLEDQADAVVAAYTPWFLMQTREARDDWVRLVGRKE